MKKLEKTRHKYWNISRETGFFLNMLIKDRQYKKVLEIGTSNGFSGIWMAGALSQTGGRLYTIESHYKERLKMAAENFQKAGLEKFVTLIPGHAPDIIPKTPKLFDLVFLDATKYEHIDYFNALKNRIKKGGIIITDNILSHKKELEGYLKAVKSDKSFFSVILSPGNETKNGILLSYKKSGENPRTYTREITNLKDDSALL